MAAFRGKGLRVVGCLLFFLAAVYGFFQWHSSSLETELTRHDEAPRYQTGAAFEVIDPSGSSVSSSSTPSFSSSSRISDKSPEALMAEADRLIVDTNQLLAEQGIAPEGDEDVSSQARRLTALEAEIDALSEQLDR